VTVPAAEKLPLHIKLGNGFGSMAYGVKDNGFATFLLLFYNQVLGLDAGTVGFILLLALLGDAIIDPLVGFWSDKTHSRWGKRHPWMYAAILPMAASWIMLWHPPELGTEALYLYLLLIAFLMRASVSCYEVPALSVMPALTSDYDERTALTRWRFLFAWAGGLLMLMLAFGVLLVPSEKYPVGQLNVDGYQMYGWLGAALMILATFVGALTTHKRLAKLPDTAPTHLPLGETLRQIRRTLSNRAYLVLMLSALFSFVNQGMSFSITTYLLTYYWEMPQAGFIVYAISLFIGVVGAFFLVGVLQARMEKKTGAMIAGALALLFVVSPYFARQLGLFPENGGPMLIPVLFTLITIGNSLAVCASMLIQSMAADVIESSQAETGERNEGLFFSGYFFVQKCSHGLGIFLSGAIVTLSAFPKQAKPGAVAQGVMDDFVLYYLAVLITLGVCAVLPLFKFPITRRDHEERLLALAAANGKKP
jgi:glycoside/pentoside/hexuronide:cation symporter, GPH family